MRVAATSGDDSDRMDVDTAVASSLFVGKRKHSDTSLPGNDALAHDNHDDDSSLIDTAPPSSIPTSHSLPALSPSVPSAPSSSVRTSSNPLKKKKTASTRNSAGKVSSSVTGAPSSNIAMKITPAIAIHGMQGTLNRLTDVMERNLGPIPDLAMTQRTQALTLLQERDDNLTIEEKSEMIHHFTSNVAIAEVYLALNNDELRQAWLQSLLKR